MNLTACVFKLLALFTVLFTASLSFAEERCITPDHAIICTISDVCDRGLWLDRNFPELDKRAVGYIALVDTIQGVANYRYYSGPPGSYCRNSIERAAALEKARVQAQTLVNAGVCRTIVDTTL